MAIKIKELQLGEGRTKICVPIVARSLQDLEKQLDEIPIEHTDLLEWRLDFFLAEEKINEQIEKQMEEKIVAGLDRFYEKYPKHPLIATFRSKTEGGEMDFSWENYEKLILLLAKCEKVDLIDVELFAKEGALAAGLCEEIHKNGKLVLFSNHDFQKTPPKEDMMKRLGDMDALGADILKIAVMPQTEEDVLTLLETTLAMKKKTTKPLITMSMGKLGMISRISGRLSGSAVTFATGGKASAPGQLKADEVVQILELLQE